MIREAARKKMPAIERDFFFMRFFYLEIYEYSFDLYNYEIVG
jgi:hypothetical protein